MVRLGICCLIVLRKTFVELQKVSFKQWRKVLMTILSDWKEYGECWNSRGFFLKKMSERGGELFNESLNKWKGSKVWPNRNRKKKVMDFFERLILWNRRWNRMVRKIVLYQVPKLGGNISQWFYQNLSVQSLRLGLKLDHRNFLLGWHSRKVIILLNCWQIHYHYK